MYLEEVGMLRTGFIWLRIGTSVRQYDNESSASIKCKEGS
jgi:hypothetical protein